MPDRLDNYDFHLPEHQIAQTPHAPRDRSRLMVLRRNRPGWSHRIFNDLPGLLPAGALLVLNNTRVLPHRLTATLPSKVKVEALLVEEESEPGHWRALVKKARRIKAGMRVPFSQGRLPAIALERDAQGQWLLAFEDPETLSARLQRHGLAPLPPYIQRDLHGDYQPETDRGDYQTCFARFDGAIAAPTAGLHFTAEVLSELTLRGIEMTELTLHVGAGTFAKVKTVDPALHTMHEEWYAIPGDTARKVLQAREQGRPVIAVGTTTVRALESWAAAGAPEGQQAWSRLFIRPPFSFRVLDGLITNFHLPKSTLLMLVSAFHGRENLLSAYAEAIGQGYRFFSFGDCMALLPTHTN